MAAKPKLSAHLQAERDFVEKKLGDRIICQWCGANLGNCADRCVADLSEPCAGFLAIEQAKEEFKTGPRRSAGTE